MQTPRAVSLTLLSLAIATSASLAGPLTPPVGPVGSTYKTLADTEPRTALSSASTPGDINAVYRITQPGSYYLTGNITASPGKYGINILTSNVTIDLNGFTISGGSTAIVSTGNGDDITVRNGFIGPVSLNGIDLGTTLRARVENVSVKSPTGAGIAVLSSAIISRCQVRGGANGISTGDSCCVCDSVVVAAVGNGFRFASNCVVSNCIADSCTGNGFLSNGFAARLTNCSALSNGSRGFDIGDWSSIENCLAYANTGVGFNLGTGGVIRHCVAEWNTAQGIITNGGCTVADNQIRYGSNGITAIWLQGTQNHCEGNNCIAYGYGVYTTTTSNLIVKNTVSGAINKSYQIAGGNAVGTILVPNYTLVTISGNSGGGLGTSDPNANFAY